MSVDPTQTQPEPQQQQQAQPGTPLGDDAPSISGLSFQLCTNCKTGVWQVTNYDPHALFEQDQSMGGTNQLKSGGTYSVYCPHCDYSASIAMNPEKPS